MGSRSREALLTMLTWKGHDFIDHARDEVTWKRAVDTIARAGGAMTIEVLKAVLVRMTNAIGITLR